MTLRRYINFEKFAYLLTSGLFCPKSSLFEDQWEGLIPEPGNDYYEKYIVNFSKAREWIYVSCWHMEAGESYAMWKIYGEHQYSVCIETTINKLEQVFQECDSAHSIYRGAVGYYMPEERGKAPVSWKTLKESPRILQEGLWRYGTNHFQKHKAYSFEKEYRVMIMDQGFNLNIDNESSGVTLRVDPKELIEGVVASPRAPDWFCKVVDNISQKYSLDLKVRRSNLQLQHKGENKRDMKWQEY